MPRSSSLQAGINIKTGSSCSTNSSLKRSSYTQLRNVSSKAVGSGVVTPVKGSPKYLTGWDAAKVLAISKGHRPPPSDYLDKNYIDEHLKEFDGGGSRFMTKSSFDNFGIGQTDGTSFIMPSSEADAIIASSKGAPRALEAALGLPDKALDSAQLLRVDIANPQSAGLSIPSGNEVGANSLWIPGGKLPNGSSEAIIDASSLLPDQITTTPVTGKVP
jgi:hypothetical protein